MNSPFKRAAAVLGALAVFATAMVGVAVTVPTAAMGQDPKPHFVVTLKDGTVDIELLPEVAPLHVERIVTLTERGDYDGVLFHRVIDGFMAQTGDVQYGKTGSADFNPAFAGAGGSDLPDVVQEFNAESFTRGAVGAARSNDPNSFNSQFFICFDDCTFLDGQYTVFGRVVSGMEFVDNITRGEPPANPDTIISAKIENR
jgi:cyclophilin family peptidyl-prolyl cis-trans isomerase